LTIENPETLECLVIRGTAEHPFFVQGKGWMPLGELQEGDKLVAASGEILVVQSKEHYPEQTEVYNIEVEDAHTYFVGETLERSVLVHNLCPLCDGSRPLTARSPICDGRCQIVTNINRDPAWAEQMVSQVTTVATVAVSTVPGVGESMDIVTILDPNSTETQVAVAAVSLFMSLLSCGFKPSFGSLGKVAHHADTLGDFAKTAGRVEHVVETPAQQAARTAKQYAAEVGHQKSVMNVVVNGPGCFTAGTQVVVGMEYDADGHFVQYDTVSDTLFEQTQHFVYLGFGIVAVSLVPVLRRRKNMAETNSDAEPSLDILDKQNDDSPYATHEKPMKTTANAEVTSVKSRTVRMAKSGKTFALIGCLLLAMFCFWYAMPGSNRQSISEQAITPVVHQPPET
jgi:hypothetical protein